MMAFTLPGRHCEPLAARRSKAAGAVMAALNCCIAALPAMTETVEADAGWFDTNCDLPLPCWRWQRLQGGQPPAPAAATRCREAVHGALLMRPARLDGERLEQMAPGLIRKQGVPADLPITLPAGGTHLPKT